MKTLNYTLVIIMLAGLFVTEDVNGTPPKKPNKGYSKSSCTMTRAKFTDKDLIDYKFGVVFGKNISTIKAKNNNSLQDIINGYMGGAAMQIIWPKGFILQPAIVYSQKGCKFAGSGMNYHIDYLEIPVRAMYRLQMMDIKPFAFVMPYASYNLKLSTVGDLIPDDLISDKVNKYDYGFGAGAGFDIWKIQVSFQYSWGFAQIIDEAFKVNSKVFTLSAGVFF